MLAVALKRQTSRVSQHLKTFIHKKPHIVICEQMGKFTIKTANSRSEKNAAFRLRQEVFQKEFQKAPTDFGIDRDRFDDIADHLIIKDNDNDQIVGTYRLLCSQFCEMFYSQTEFDLKHFLASPGVKVELSRACIADGYRNGITLSLLWKGVCRYLSLVKADLLFGCSSVALCTPEDIVGLMRYFHEHNLASVPWGIRPLSKYDLSADILASWLQVPTSDSQLMPPLLRTYLKAGAKLALIPAYDKEFNCFDFFTVLAVRDLEHSFMKRFGLNKDSTI